MGIPLKINKAKIEYSTVGSNVKKASETKSTGCLLVEIDSTPENVQLISIDCFNSFKQRAEQCRITVHCYGQTWEGTTSELIQKLFQRTD